MCFGLPCDKCTVEYAGTVTGRISASQPNTQELLPTPLNVGSLWRRKQDGCLVRIRMVEALRPGRDGRVRYTTDTGGGYCRLGRWRESYEPVPMTAKECGAKSIKALPPINVDFSAIERRVIEALEGWGQGQQKGVDFHRLRAAEIFNVRPSEVTNLMRRVGKAANFIDAYNSKEK